MIQAMIQTTINPNPIADERKRNMQQETQTHETMLNAIGQHLGLSPEQHDKLVQLSTGEEGLSSAVSLKDVFRFETDANGHLHVEKSATTVFPITVTPTVKILSPKTGSWDVRVYINGNRIYHNPNMKYGHEYAVKVTTGWGNSKIKVEAQWSERHRTRVEVSVHL